MMGSKKTGEILLTCLLEYRQVTTIDHTHAERARACNQRAEVRIQLRGAAGDIERLNIRCSQKGDHMVHRCEVHLFRSRRTGVHVAVHAALIALVTEINLERLEFAPGDLREIGRLQEG